MMKRTMGSVLMSCVALAFVLSAGASEDVTAEKMGQFFPPAWDEETVGKRAFSNLEITGHQKASTSQYYAFGQVEFIYYAKQDSVYSKRVEKLKARDKKFEQVEVSGNRAILFTRNRVIADLEGEILIYLECYTCETGDDLMARFQEIDLAGIKGLLVH